MFIGGYISAAGLGLTCPEWPLCPNGLLPNDEFLVEWIHRFVAATTSVLVAVTAVFSWRSPNSNSKIRFTSAFACGLIVVQISLGALVIDTLLHAVLEVTGTSYIFHTTGNHIVYVDLYDLGSDGKTLTYSFNISTQSPFGYIFIISITIGAIMLAIVIGIVYIPKAAPKFMRRT